MNGQTFTHEAKLEALIDYIAQTDYHKNTIKIDIDNELKPIYESEKENFPLLVREALFRVLFEQYHSQNPDLEKKESYYNVWEKVYEYHIVLDTKNVKKMQNIKLSSGVQCFDIVVLGLGVREGFNRKPTFVCEKGCAIPFECGSDRELPKKDNCPTHDLPLSVDESQSYHDFIQRIVIQEQLNDARNITPIDYDARIIGDMVGDAFVGQKKRILAVPRLMPKLAKGKLTEQKLLFDIISMHDLEEEKKLYPSNKEIEDYRKQAEDPEWFNKLVNSFASHLIGNELTNVKKGLFLALIGGNEIENGRADINVGLFGDPSVAKSSLLKECQTITHKSIYTSGRGSSAAGLTIGMVKRPDGTFLPQAGILPLCDRGVALIDEFDKMDEIDRSGMHEAMEQQSVSIAKAGISITLSARATVIAAANPKFGKWDDNMPILENINLPPPLLSRFDLKFRILDIPDEMADSKKAAFVLSKFKEEKIPVFSRLQLLALINHAKSLRPRLSDEASVVLQKFYVNLRKKDTKDIRIDIRSLESLARLATAHAKLYFKDFVDVSDAHAVIDLYKASLSSFGIDLEYSGEQTHFLGNKKELNKHETFWMCFAKCMDEHQTVSKEDMLNELSQTKYFSDESAKQFFEQMARGANQQLIEGMNGRFKRIT